MNPNLTTGQDDEQHASYQIALGHDVSRRAWMKRFHGDVSLAGNYLSQPGSSFPLVPLFPSDASRAHRLQTRHADDAPDDYDVHSFGVCSVRSLSRTVQSLFYQMSRRRRTDVAGPSPRQACIELQ